MKAKRTPTRSVESVLFIFGPPGPEQFKAQVREWAAAQNRTESQVYFDFMQRKLTDWCGPNTECGIDSFMSRALDHPVSVHEPEVTWWWDTEQRPALRLMGGSIRSTIEPGTIAYLENKEFVNLLLTALCLLFQVERVEAQIIYDDFIPWSQVGRMS